jgi:hypothetical protein
MTTPILMIQLHGWIDRIGFKFGYQVLVNTYLSLYLVPGAQDL